MAFLNAARPAAAADAANGSQKSIGLGGAISVLDTRFGVAEQGVVLTAVPAAEKWRMKAVSEGGAIHLPGIFRNRLEALGACVLLAQQCGGKVVS